MYRRQSRRERDIAQRRQGVIRQVEGIIAALVRRQVLYHRYLQACHELRSDSSSRQLTPQIQLPLFQCVQVLRRSATWSGVLCLTDRWLLRDELE